MVAMMPNDDDEDPDDDNDDVGYEERIAALEEDAGLSEATLATLTSQLSDLDSGIATQRDLCQQRRTKLDELRGRRTTLQAAVDDNERLVSSVGGALRRCLEAYRRRMAAAIAEDRRGEGGEGDGTVEDGGDDDDEEEDTDGASTPAAYDSMEDDESLPCSLAPSENVGEVVVAAATTTTSTTATGGDDADGDGTRAASSEVEIGASGQGAEAEAEAESRAGSEAGEPMIPDDDEEGDDDDGSDDEGFDDGLPIDEWTGPPYNEPMKPPLCAGDADATAAEESPSHPRGGVQVGRDVEVRCWAGSLLVPPPSSSSRDASLLARLIRRAVTVEGMEVEARLKLRRPPDRGGGGSSGSGSSISIVDIRRGFARGSCLDPMAVCHRWHSAGRRRLLPWERAERGGGGDGGDDDRGDGYPSPAAAVDEDDDGDGGETFGTTSSGSTTKPSSSSPSSLLSPWLRYGSIMSSSGRRRADGDDTAVVPSIDPNAMLCPYEMAGSCVDPTCPYQHVAVSSMPQTTSTRRRQQPPPVVVERYVPLPDLRRIPVPPSSLHPNPPSSSPPAPEDDPPGDDAASASAAAVVPVGMERTTKGKKRKRKSPEERPEESAATTTTTTTTTTTRVPGEDEDGDGSSKRSRSTSPDHPPPPPPASSVTSSHHEERDFVALPDASSSSSSSSLSSLWGDGDDDSSDDDGGGGGERSVDESSSIGQGETTTMPWWWREDLIAPAVGLGDASSLHRLPLPSLLATLGFTLTRRRDAEAGTVETSSIDPPAVDLADEYARVVVNDAWRSVLLRSRPTRPPSGGAGTGAGSFSSAACRFGCAALDCARVCTSAGRIRLASMLLGTCERLLVSSSTLADGKKKEKGDDGGTTPDTTTTSVIRRLVASCLTVARSSILPAVRGASACEISAAQTSLFLLSEWLRALSSDLKADDEAAVAPQSDDDHHDEQRRGRRRVMTEGWWSRLLARCARPFDDDAAAGDVGVSHMMATGEVGEGATSWVRREFRVSTAIRPTDDEEEDDSFGILPSSPPSAGTADVERLLLFLRCASFGGRLANAVSMRFSSSVGAGAGAGAGRGRDVESVREMLLEPLWVEMEAFSRGAEEGDATSPSTERGSQKLLTNEVRATCCLLIIGPVHFQVTSAIMLTTGIAPGAASSSSPSSSPPSSSLGSAREYASLSLHDSSFHRAISRLVSIGTSRPGIPRSTDRDGRPHINDNPHHAWNPYLRGLLLAPLLAVSAATAVELGLHSKAQLRLENALSLDGGGDDERRPGGGALRGGGHGLVGGMVYSELVWSQLILLRSYFSSSSPKPQPPPLVQPPGGPIPPDRAGISAASAARPDVQDDDDDTDPQTALLSRRVIAFGVHPSHLSMGGDSALIRSAAFEHRPSHARVSSSASASSDDEGAACCRVHRMLFHSSKEDHRSGERVPSAEPDRAVDGSEVRRDDPTATASSSISTDCIPLSTADGGFPRSVLLLGNSLKEITARRCRLSTLPETLGLHLPLLQVLDLSSNDLSKLPNSMCDLVELRILRVRDNVLTSLPGDVGRLARLIELDVSGNVLEKFPTSICDCVSLEVIDASNNGLKLMPPELTLRLKSLHTLNLNGNPLVED